MKDILQAPDHGGTIIVQSGQRKYRRLHFLMSKNIRILLQSGKVKPGVILQTYVYNAELFEVLKKKWVVTS